MKNLLLPAKPITLDDFFNTVIETVLLEIPEIRVNLSLKTTIKVICGEPCVSYFNNEYVVISNMTTYSYKRLEEAIVFINSLLKEANYAKLIALQLETGLPKEVKDAQINETTETLKLF